MSILDNLEWRLSDHCWHDHTVEATATLDGDNEVLVAEIPTIDKSPPKIAVFVNREPLGDVIGIEPWQVPEITMPDYEQGTAHRVKPPWLEDCEYITVILHRRGIPHRLRIHIRKIEFRANGVVTCSFEIIKEDGELTVFIKKDGELTVV